MMVSGQTVISYSILICVLVIPMSQDLFIPFNFIGPLLLTRCTSGLLTSPKKTKKLFLNKQN